MAVGGDQDTTAARIDEVADALDTLGGGQGAGDGRDVDLLQFAGQVFGDVVGGVDEPAEHDRVEAVLEQGLDLLDQGGEPAS